MPFRTVSAFDGKKGYIDSVDDTSPMTVVQLGSASYLLPDGGISFHNHSNIGSLRAYRVVTDSPESGTAVAVDVTAPDVIAGLVRKYAEVVAAERLADLDQIDFEAADTESQKYE